MFEFNSKTEVNKEFKVKEILKMVKADRNIKNDALSIEKIVLKNVISEETLNISSGELCREIYIFDITLKERRIPVDFIKSFDKNIELHTYFIFKYNDEVKELCIYRNIENDTIKRRDIYETDWSNYKLKELPYSISIKEIYENLIFNIVDLKHNENEDVDTFLERYKRIEKIKKEIIVLDKKAFKEVQPKRKFDIGRDIKAKKAELKALQGDNNG